MLRLGVGQMEPMINDSKGNLTKLSAILKSASKEQVDVLVLPELMNSGYVFESKEEAQALAETIPEGPFSKKLKTWSEGGGLVVAGLCEDSQDGLHNSAALFGGGKHLGIYRKIHLFDKEKLWFIPGKEEPPVVNFKGSRFGVIVCFDWAFPELSRVLTLKGAQVILHPANLILRSLYCVKAMITRSIENHVFTATASRIGVERGVRFLGNSQVTDPRGLILLSMNETETGVSWVEIEPASADEKALTPTTDVMKDRVPELYRRITENND